MDDHISHTDDSSGHAIGVAHTQLEEEKIDFLVYVAPRQVSDAKMITQWQNKRL